MATPAAPAGAALRTAAVTAAACSSGAHTLSHFGDRLYPEMGNGGYASLHTDLHLNYDAIANLFLPGTRAGLRVKATQCLTDLSFDFEQVTTEPVGNDSWMPMNNHPLAKPTYDIYDTTNIGKVATGPGELVGYTPPVGASYQPVPAPPPNAADMNFPAGSVTWHWHSPEPIANYLVENSIGAYDLSARTSQTSGVQYWEAQASTISAARKATNKIAMDNQEDIVNLQTTFNGPWPFTTDGVVVGTPSASFEEEMQGKITFAGGTIGGANGTSLGTFNHENMHQWFGDNVAEAAFNLTFWKEGFATLGEYLNTARGTPPGNTGGPAFEASLVNRFNGAGNYNSNTLWTTAPSNPTVGSLFTTSNTYTRPGTAYVALWQILMRNGMIAAMHDLQSTYGGKNITEPQLEDVFRSHLPVQSASCNARLTSFFTQWFDTAYPSGGGLNKPQLTGPGLNGPGFPCAQVTPASPDGANGWYRSPVAIAWSGFPTVQATQTATRNGCVDETVSTDGASYERPCGVTVTTTATGAVVADSGPVSETFKLDGTAPTTSATLTPTGVGAWYSPRTVSLGAQDATSGVAFTEYRVDGGPWTTYTGPFAITSFGPHTLDVRSTDVAGNAGASLTTSWGSDFTASQQLDGLSTFVTGLRLDGKTAKALQHDPTWSTGSSTGSRPAGTSTTSSPRSSTTSSPAARR